MCDPETVDYVKEFKEKIDNLTVVEFDGHDWIEVDPSDDIDQIQLKYIMFGIDEDLIDDTAQFESIYEALCIVDED